MDFRAILNQTDNDPIPMTDYELPEPCDCVSYGSYYAEDVELSFCNNCDNVVDPAEAPDADDYIKQLKEEA